MLNSKVGNLGAFAVAAFMMFSVASSQAFQTPPNAANPTKAALSPDEIYKVPVASIDSRVKAEKITQNEPPPLPQRIVLPKPPTFHLSDQASQTPIKPELWRSAKDALHKGLAFLRTQQAANGGWMNKVTAAATNEQDKPSSVTVAVTALALKAFVQADRDAMKDEHVRKALKLVLGARSSDGSFDQSGIANYVTSAVLQALASIDDKSLRGQVDDAIQWLSKNQWEQTEGISPRQDWFGGAGYGNSCRPDMSNTQMMLDALYDAGLSPDEPAFQKALAFASRNQNLKATNKSEWAGNDGGFIYTPANGGESKASEVAGEGVSGEKLPPDQSRSLRSYGSMTYAGFKSMLYAGLSQDDMRVRAAFEWIRNHWTFEENPGLGKLGLYYYYHTMARTLTIAQQHEITDAAGTKHNWREELIEALLKRQQPDGSWLVEAKRWNEDDPALTTIYSVLSLEEILKPVIASQPSSTTK